MGARKGRIPWNKGLTKETDERVKRNALNTKKSCNKKEYLMLLSEKQKKYNMNLMKEEKTIRAMKGIKNRRSYKGKGNPQYGKHSNKGQTKKTHKWRKIAANKNSGKNNGMFRKIRKYYYACIGYRKDLGHICRSSWEANFARILNYNNINYEYEPTAFKIYDEKTYTPDFYIPKEKKYYEIKGHITKEVFNKLRYVLDKYNIDIILIGPNEYKELKKKYENIIDWEDGVKGFKKNINDIKFIETNIIKIIKSHYKPKRIYNLSVEGDDCFIANGIVVHNTKPHVIKPKHAKTLAWTSAGVKRPSTKEGWKKAGKAGTAHFAQVVNHPGNTGAFFMRNAVWQHTEEIKKLLLSEVK